MIIKKSAILVTVSNEIMSTEMRHFLQSEFYCGCGCGLGFESMSTDLVSRLDIARGWAGVPFVVTSSIRCKAHNDSLPYGKPNSAHLTGNAVDLACTSSRTRMKIYDALRKAGFDRIGISENFLHVDNDKTKPEGVLWVY